DGLRQAGKNLRTAFRDPQSAAAHAADALLGRAQQTAASHSAPEAERIAASKLLGYEDFARARPTLVPLLAASDAQPLQLAAVRTVGAFSHADVAKTMLEPWPGYTPAVREEVLTVLLARRDRVGALLAAIENKIVSPGQVSAARRTQ